MAVKEEEKNPEVDPGTPKYLQLQSYGVESFEMSLSLKHFHYEMISRDPWDVPINHKTVLVRMRISVKYEGNFRFSTDYLEASFDKSK